MYSELSKILSVPDIYQEQTEIAFQSRPDCTQWLTDPLCRDQFVLRSGHDTEVSWANLIQGEGPALVYGGEREKQMNLSWCESYVQWSPKGTYLATFHPQGIKLWGDEFFVAQGRYLHKGVELLEFSPCENYMVTYNFSNYDSAEAIIVWDVRSGSKIRTFSLKDPREVGFWAQGEVTEEKGGKKTERVLKGRICSYDPSNSTFKLMEGITEYDRVPTSKVVALQDPNKLKWSRDGKYVARLGVGIIQVYETPSMKLLDSKSIAAKDVMDFQWSPGGGDGADSNMISYWSPASGNLPAIISVIQIPDRTVISSRKLFDVQDNKMIWQNDGDFLCVKMTKTAGKKRSSILMLFRIRENEVPVELLELQENVVDVQWEPSKEKFAVIYGESRSATIAFYTMGTGGAGSVAANASVVAKSAAAPKKGEMALLYTLTGKQCSEIVWCPVGGILAIGYIASDTCIFELHDVDNNVTLGQRRHDRGNKLLWDPSGRCIVSCTLTALRQTAVRGQPDDGYNMYTFQGYPICQVRKEKLYQFAWRPRPDILTAAEKKSVIKNLKKFEKMFDREDKVRKQRLESEAFVERKKLADSFLGKLNSKKIKVRNAKNARIALRDGYDSDDDNNFQIDVQVVFCTCSYLGSYFCFFSWRKQLLVAVQYQCRKDINCCVQ